MDTKLMLLFSTYAGFILAKQPNIVLIVADDNGWNDIGYHGSHIKTPTLDKLAAGGIKLENHYAQPVCSPTRSALLSGRMPIHTGMHKKIPLTDPVCHPLQDKFLPEVLRDLGYATHMVGKWHVGFYKEQCVPTSRGFDSFFGFLSGQQAYFTHISKGYLDFNSQTAQTLLQAERNYTGVYSTHIFVEKAQHVIHSHHSTTPNKPLFLYLPFQSVHIPNEVPGIYGLQYRHVSDAQRRTYSAMVTCMDEAIRNVTQALKESQMLENTIIIFLSDNGGACGSGANNWPLRGRKGSLFEGGIRVIAFIHSPLLNRSGIISHDLFHVTDWLPTIVEAAGGDTRDMDIDGVSQWAMLRDGVASKRTEILHDIDMLSPKHPGKTKSDVFDTKIRAAIRMGEWKLVTGSPGSGKWISKPQPNTTAKWFHSKSYSKKNLWLFNVKDDPREMNDVSGIHPDLVKRMLQRLKHYRNQTLEFEWPNMDLKGTPAPGGVWKPWATEVTSRNKTNDKIKYKPTGKILMPEVPGVHREDEGRGPAILLCVMCMLILDTLYGFRRINRYKNFAF